MRTNDKLSGFHVEFSGTTISNTFYSDNEADHAETHTFYAGAYETSQERPALGQ